MGKRIHHINNSFLIVYFENEHGEILVYERLSGGGEARLHGQSSIGVGGHMNDVPGAESINEVLRVNAQEN